ncbi:MULTISPECIES: metallophosphoesterase family protein [Carnobacterium]|uniref:metallophosphoesterase family protein n=1 Tax=Carnobacterium TaxID=2747 RepID=UPI0010721B6E|nr:MULTISPECIES: DNA repair exonuclease [Carnobacterium]MDT1938498.1 DNA repair exonuclease [Carnobacterium divergens]MDT1940936.1 DNA repair exonuclease [Carnobacterium divergens]MDT1946734.1 DNA repair exonuclease [Carnobacterium divergens]MDT1949171.1 DNA repair exonuclease [Carnobacterium divergens]MDT1954349.1 DNA repair exonuclease [Carnobacterium divergens]
MVQFIHGADLHLDSPFIGLKTVPDFLWEKIYQSTFTALTNLVNHAIEKQVDFVLLAGDIYDSDDRSVKAQAFLKKEMERLNQAEIPVFICHGNHDYIENSGLHLKMPENVELFSETVETKWLTTKNGERIAVSSFSYNSRWMTKRMITEYPKKHATADFHIGMLHGFSEGLETSHGHYAPFTINELKSKGYDYWALGHIHTRQVLATQPPILYAGNTQGRSSKETGIKGCELVTLTLGESSIETLETQDIQWETFEISLAKQSTLDDVYRKIKETIEIKEGSQKNYLLTIELVDTKDLLPNVLKKIIQGELLEALQQISATEPFIWVNQLKIQKRATEDTTEKMFIMEEWLHGIEELSKENQFNQSTNSLFDFALIEDLLESRDEDYRSRIMKQSLMEISAELTNESRDNHEN